MNTPPDLDAAQAADELVALLTLCQQLQSEKDGRALTYLMAQYLPAQGETP